MAIAQAAIGNTDTVVLTVPASTSYAITTVMVCNHAGYNSAGTNDTSFDLHFVKSGQAKSNTNMVVKEIPVPGGETFTLDTEKVILEAGDKIKMQCATGNVIKMTASVLQTSRT